MKSYELLLVGADAAAKYWVCAWLSVDAW